MPEYILLINAEKAHYLRGDDNVLYMKLSIEYSMVSDILNRYDIVFWCDSSKGEDASYDALRQMLKRLLGHYLSTRAGIQNFMYISMCYQILDYICGHFLVQVSGHQESDDQKYQDRIDMINNYIRTNYDKPISLRDLSEQLYLSNGYLSRFFKKNYQMSFMEYLTKIRLYHAVDALLYTDLPITRIAFDTGFASVQLFNDGGTFTIVIAAIIYIACGMAYTVCNLSYGSLSTVMTRDQNEIVQLNSWRMMGTNLSSVLLNAVTPPLLVAFSGNAENYTADAYTKVAIIFAICALPLFFFVYKQCKEVVKPANGAKKVTLKETFKTVVTNKPLMIVFAIQLIAMTAFFGRMGVVIYYLMYDLHAYTMIAWFMSLPSLMTVIGILVTKNLIIKVGKKKMCAIGYIGAGISLILIYFVGNATGFSNITLLLILHGVYGLFCFSFPIPMSMVPDSINYQEDRTGIRMSPVREKIFPCESNM